MPVDIPCLCQGTVAAIAIGYRHIDITQAYGSERGVCEAIRTCGIPREDLFVQSELAAEVKDYEGAKAAIQASLDTMGLDYIDLFIIHSLQPWGDRAAEDRFFEGNLAAWKAMEEALAEGKLRAIGVSNYQQQDLASLIDNASVKPMINQVLAHIGNTPFDLIDYAKSNGMLVAAYSPIAHGAILDNADIKDIKDMAAKYHVTVPQLCLRYILQLDLLALPKTTNPKHMESNAQVDFTISDADMETLKGITARDYGEASMFPVHSGKQ
ncbi:aldo/keto reductase [Sagittula sp. S175]|uniref:aldo/keto reductase n=1 Tax=Sagittula sp. S175 TaxID=3415129 RepID=UPI003C7BB544